MSGSPYTSKYSAVVLSSLLAVAFGSASQSARSRQDPVHNISPSGETGGDLLSHVRFRGASSPKAEIVDTGDPVSLHSNALQFGPHPDVKFTHQIPLPRYLSGYFHKQRCTAGRKAEHKHVDRASRQAKPQQSIRLKRWTDLGMKDNIADNGDHPLSDEPGANVHCWNESDVFDFVLPASEVAKHFPQECQHPLSCNTTCVAKVPGRDVCPHLKSGCREPTQHAVPETQLGTVQNENKQLELFEKNVERRFREVDAKLAQLLLDCSHHKDKLVELGQNLNHLVDALKEQLAAASAKTLQSLDRNAAEMKDLLNTKSDSAMTAISSVLSLIQGDSKTHLWTLKGYAALKADAIKNGAYGIRCPKVYIGRYLISWGIHFRKSTGGVNLHLTIQLHKGINDEFLEWPFSNELELSIIHPESGKKLQGRDKPGMLESNMRFFSKPIDVSNQKLYFPLKFQSGYLEGNGYVKNDQLLLKLEVLS